MHRDSGGALQPIQLLPDELLCEIFRWCLWHDPRYIMGEAGVMIRFESEQAPMVFTYVNRQWRRAALACTELWTYGLLFEDSVHVGKSNLLASLDQIPAQLEVGLVTKFSTDPHLDQSSAAASLEAIFRPFTSSNSISVLCLDDAPLSALQSLPSGLLPCLTELVLSMSTAEDPAGLDFHAARPIVAFEGISSLVRISSSRTFLNLAGLGDLRIDWSRVTTVNELKEDSTTTLSNFLAHCLPLCSNLFTLSLSMRPSDTGSLAELSSALDTRIAIPSITNLFIEIHYGTFESDDEELLIPDFLYQFAFPGVKTLTLDAEGLQAPSGSRFRKVLEEAFRGAKITRLMLDMSCSARDVCLDSNCPPGTECVIEKETKATSEKACQKLSHMLKAFPDIAQLDLLMPLYYDGIFDVLAGDLDGPGSSKSPARVRTILPALVRLGILNWEFQALTPAMTKAFQSHKFTRFIQKWLEAPSGRNAQGQQNGPTRLIGIADSAPDTVKAIIGRFASSGLGMEEVNHSYIQ